ncbi:acetolactate decarboxylase [Oceanihabitans sp.]|nr:acetolactate decarboxylase [Oceanihabitans sp.]
MKHVFLVLILMGLIACNSKNNSIVNKQETYPNIKIAGAMKNVMWKGELEGIIKLDTIENKKGLYGIGPVSYLTGEILINNGQAYVSKVLTDSTMTVEKTYNISAPFLVYGNINEWQEIDLPKYITTIKDLENYIDKKTRTYKRPFGFKIIGEITKAQIHIQNLPNGTHVSSPEEAHKGQTNYDLKNEDVEIIGFFSTKHKGVFTHHDSFLHLHLITKDERKMGHLDMVACSKMKLYLPRK